jgi:hypothetical protein
MFDETHYYLKTIRSRKGYEAVASNEKGDDYKWLSRYEFKMTRLQCT